MGKVAATGRPAAYDNHLTQYVLHKVKQIHEQFQPPRVVG